MIQEKDSESLKHINLKMLISNINEHLNKDVDLYFLFIKNTLKEKEKV